MDCSEDIQLDFRDVMYLLGINAIITRHVKFGQGLKALRNFSADTTGSNRAWHYHFCGGSEHTCQCRGPWRREACSKQIAQVVMSHELQLFVGSVLVDIYAKCGSIEYAGRVYQQDAHLQCGLLWFVDVLNACALVLVWWHLERADVSMNRSYTIRPCVRCFCV